MAKTVEQLEQDLTKAITARVNAEQAYEAAYAIDRLSRDTAIAKRKVEAAQRVVSRFYKEKSSA